MSIDRFDPFSAGYGRSGPQRPDGPPGFAGKTGSGHAADKLSDFGVPLAGAVSKSFVTQWGQSAATYGSHSMLAEFLNRATAPETPLNKKIQTLTDKATTKLDLGNASLSKTEATAKAVSESKLLNEARKQPSPQAFRSSAASDATRAASNAVGYSELLHLGDQQVPFKKLSKERFSGAIKDNLEQFREQIKPGNVRDFFSHTSAKDYLKNTVVANNIEPVKNLKNATNNREIGTGLIRSFVMGLMGYDVLKHTYQTYKSVKAKEDGSLKGKWHTFKETSKAFGKYSVRDGSSWELAGIGAAIGRAVLPIAICGVSAGGILVGALAGILAQKGMDKLLHTGDHDPHQPPKKPEHQKAQHGQGNGQLRNPGGVGPSK